MQDKKNHTVEYILIAIMAFMVMYCMVYISNSADTDEYISYMTENGLDAKTDIDLIELYKITMERLENNQKISFSNSSLRYLGYGAVINFCWIAMVGIEMSKKYAQERMYGDAKWGTPKQFKKLCNKRRRFYFTDHPPFNYLYHAVLYVRVFKKVWKENHVRR